MVHVTNSKSYAETGKRSIITILDSIELQNVVIIKSSSTYGNSCSSSCWVDKYAEQSLAPDWRRSVACDSVPGSQGSAGWG